MKDDRRRRSIKDGLSCRAARDESGGVGQGGKLDVTEPDAVGRRRGLCAVQRMMACVAQ